jgi:hypothetical protein
MPKPSHAAASLAALFLAAQPCAAADDFAPASARPQRTSAFLGAAVSLPLGPVAKARASARLQFNPLRAAGDPLAQGRRSPGLELGLGKSGKPALHIAGQPAPELGRRMNLGGTKGTVLIVVGGVVLLVLLAAAVAHAQPTPGPHKGTFD